jgi:diguanylate cyclase (GGDEF)-like protein
VSGKRSTDVGGPGGAAAAQYDPKEAREIRRLSAVVRLLDLIEEEPLAEAIVREVLDLSGADYALLFAARHGGSDLELRGSTLPMYHEVRRALESSTPGRGPLSRREAGPLSREEFDVLFAGEPPPGLGPESLAVAPLVRDMFFAVLVVGREAGAGELGQVAVQSSIAFARAVAVHLRNVQLMGRYRDLMIRDDQTRSFNRRYFDSFLGEEFIRASRYRSPLSLIFVDLDNLKRINERHGHSMGSCAIRKVADRILPLIRTVDKLFRYGGDEFCVVLPETDWEGALEVAERLRAAICSAPFLTEEVGGVELTASFGVASYPVHATTKEALVRAADEAMFRIKQAGKNSISVAGEPIPGSSQTS